MIRITWVVFSFLLAASAFAGGYEKATLWSGKHAPRSGAVVGDVRGAESLYFNPAGLADMPTAGEVSLNFSPTLSKFTGPLALRNNVNSVDGRQQFSPVFGAVAGYRATDRLGLGLGVYVSGGTRSRYTNLDYASLSVGAPYTLKPTVETDLNVTEAALGAGYEVAPGFRIGASWRYVMVRANFATVGYPATPGNPAQAIYNVSANELEANRWNAFRLGAQYAPEGGNWGLGAHFRSAVKFVAKGTTTGWIDTAAGSAETQGTGGPIDVTNTFPLQATFGGFYRFGEDLKLSSEYAFMNYSKNKELALSGTFSGVALPSIRQNWKNQHTFRAGAEKTLASQMKLRAGYTLTTATTPDDRARSTFSSPGLGHILGVGAGDTFFNDRVDIDAGLEYSFASGKGTNPDEQITTEKDYKTRSYAFHLGTTFRF